MLNYEGIDYDLNALFQFDMLKKIIEALAKRQIDLDQKMGTIIKGGNVQISNENFGDLLIKDDDDNIEGLDTDKRLERLERKLVNIGILEKWIRNVEKKTETLNEGLIATNDKIDGINNQVQTNKDDIEKLNEKVNEILTKLNSYNVYTNVPEDTESGNMDQSKGMVMNLEQRMMAKFSLIDEKIKKMEEENNINIANINKRIEEHEAAIKRFNDVLNILKKEITEKDDKYKQNLLDLEEKLKKRLADITKNIENKNKEIEDKLTITDQAFKNSKKEEKEEDNKKDTNRKSDNDLELEWKQIEENKKMILELEKKLRDIPQDLKIDEINEKIDKIQQSLKSKLTKGDLEDIIEKIGVLENIIDELKDFTVKQNDLNGRKNQDYLSVSKKIENINSTLLLLQTGMPHKSSGGSDNKGPDLSIFNELIKTINNQISALQNECDEFRRYFTDILPMMKTLATITDLKNLEDALKAMLEEYKLLAQRKFADKIETQKSIKLIDTQIKHFIAEYIKKGEKGENWMLAAKPVGGYKCASCESYIGELTNKWEYLPWNKYPTRDFVDKSYRMGNGFSRMLQKLNLDVRRSEDLGQNLSFSDGEEKSKSRNQSEEKNRKKQTLPQLRSRQQIESQTSGGILSSNNNIENKKEENLDKLVKGIVTHKEPKVVKIYKKLKGSNEMTITKKEFQDKYA